MQRSVKMDVRMVDVVLDPTAVLVFMDSLVHSAKEVSKEKWELHLRGVYFIVKMYRFCYSIRSSQMKQCFPSFLVMSVTWMVSFRNIAHSSRSVSVFFHQSGLTSRGQTWAYVYWMSDWWHILIMRLIKNGSSASIKRNNIRTFLDAKSTKMV